MFKKSILMTYKKLYPHINIKSFCNVLECVIRNSKNQYNSKKSATSSFRQYLGSIHATTKIPVFD